MSQPGTLLGNPPPASSTMPVGQPSFSQQQPVSQQSMFVGQQTQMGQNVSETLKN